MKKKRIIIASVLAVVVVLGLAAGAIALFYKPQAKVNDYTTGEQQMENDRAIDVDVGEGEACAVISPLVNYFEGDEADKINSSIKSIQSTTEGVVMTTTTTQTQMSELGVGDIFYLEGSEDSPFEQTFIGKVESKTVSNNEISYIVDAPAVDEVFDVLKIDCNEELTNDKISVIETFDGVTVTETSPLEENFDLSDIKHSDDATKPIVSNLSYKNAEEPEIGQMADKKPPIKVGDKAIVFDYEIDLLDKFGLNEKDKTEFQDVYMIQEGYTVKVYTTKTGKTYHRSDCRYLQGNKTETTLTDAKNKGLKACKACTPQVLKDDKGVVDYDAELKLNGRIGLENISADITFDWNVMEATEIQELAVKVDGRFVAEATLNANVHIDLGGRKTQVSLPFGAGHLEGLREKMFPLAFVGFDTTLKAVTASGNDGIRQVTSAMPLTLGLIVYADASGSIVLGSTVTLNASYDFSYTNEFIKDGKLINDTKFDGNPSISFDMVSELKGDIDAHIGASVVLYVFNLNVLELAIARAGTEAQGMVKCEFHKNLLSGESSGGWTHDIYLRGYAKILVLEIKLKAKIDILWGFVEFSEEIGYRLQWKDMTLFELGKKGTARFSSSDMSFTSVTAKDKSATYYMDTNGQLIRKSNGNTEVLYSDTFFVICGIDETYIYILRVADGGGYDLYRIHKTQGTSRKILESIAYLYLFDSTDIYFSYTFDTKVASKFDRETLNDEYLIECDDEIRIVANQGNFLYVVTQDTSFFASFFGGGNKCYLFDSYGNKIADYGENVALENYLHTAIDDTYYFAARMTSGGFLRGVADTVYWVSANKSSNVCAEGVSGWNPLDEGIFVTQDIPAEELPAEKTDSEGNVIPEPKFRIVLFRASDGQKQNVQPVFSNQAFFTLCHADNGRWYYFDQTDDELILYSLSNNFGGKAVEKKFSLEEMPCSLTDASMVIMDNTLYFYTIKDNTTTVLYRYTIA